MMKFNLTVNDATQEGFKLIVSSDNEKELEIVQKLTSDLIAKINKIDVSVGGAE